MKLRIVVSGIALSAAAVALFVGLAVDVTDPDSGAAALTPATHQSAAAGHIAAARRVLERAIETDLLPTPAAIERARTLYAQAAALDRQATTPAHGLVLVEGASDLVHGRDAEARRRLTRALTAGGVEELLAGYLLGHAYLAADRPLAAWGEFQHVASQRPGWLAARFATAAADIALETHDVALDTLLAAAARWPRRPEPAVAVGRALENERDDPEAAQPWYERAIALGSDDPHVIDRFTSLSIERGRAADARRALTRLVALEPDRMDLRIHLGRALDRLGETDAARTELERAVALGPDDDAAIMQLAAHLMNTGDVEQALALLRAERAQRPHDGRLLAYLGHAELLVDDRLVARDTFIASCRAGFGASCTEACILDDLSSCNAAGMAAPAPPPETRVAGAAPTRAPSAVIQRVVPRGRTGGRVYVVGAPPARSGQRAYADPWAHANRLGSLGSRRVIALTSQRSPGSERPIAIVRAERGDRLESLPAH